MPTSPIPASNPCQTPISRPGRSISISSPYQKPFSRTGLAVPASNPCQRPFSRTGLAVPASGSQKTMLTDLSDHSFVRRDTGPVQLFAATQVFRLKFLHRRKFFATKPCVVVAVTNPGAVARECWEGSRLKVETFQSYPLQASRISKPPGYPSLPKIQVSRRSKSSEDPSLLNIQVSRMSMRGGLLMRR